MRSWMLCIRRSQAFIHDPHAFMHRPHVIVEGRGRNHPWAGAQSPLNRHAIWVDPHGIVRGTSRNRASMDAVHASSARIDASMDIVNGLCT